VFGETNRGVDGDVLAGSTRHVVDDLGEVDRVGDLPVVVVHPLGFGFVVVRRNQQECIRAGGGGLLGEIQRLGRIVRASAGDNGYVLDGVDDGLDNLDVFGVTQRGALASRADRHEAVNTGGFEPLGVFSERFGVDLVVRGEGGHHRRENPAEVDVCHEWSV